jgi:hypothetical protein
MQGQLEMYMTDMHGIDSHVLEKDTGKYLKFHQMEVIKLHVKINWGATTITLLQG